MHSQLRNPMMQQFATRRVDTPTVCSIIRDMFVVLIEYTNWVIIIELHIIYAIVIIYYWSLIVQRVLCLSSRSFS